MQGIPHFAKACSDKTIHQTSPQPVPKKLLVKGGKVCYGSFADSEPPDPVRRETLSFGKHLGGTVE